MKAGGGGILPPAARTERQIVFLHAAELIDPHQQGEYDRLCGLYAIINAIRLAMATRRAFSTQESRSLFRDGISFLRDAGELASSVDTGMEIDLWSRLSAHICERASIVARAKITSRRSLRPAAKAEEIFEEIAKLILDQIPVMILLSGAYAHYTVICGIHPKRIHFFDSFGYCWVNKEVCGTEMELPLRRHQIDGMSVIAIEIDMPRTAFPRPHTIFPPLG